MTAYKGVFLKMNCRNKILVGFIGAGNMGSAIMKGVASSDELSEKISLSAFDTLPEKLEELRKCGISPVASAKDIVKTCKYVFLAVKPQVIETVLEDIAEAVTEDTVIISIAAGISQDFIRSKTRADAKVVLVMPNTPLLLGEGATALANGGCSDEEFEVVKEIFALRGIIEVVDISKMKEVIAVNSSSPAFIYLFAKGFIEYGKSVGLGEEASKNLFAKALIGSAKMITDSGYTIDELIKMVSSPGGTTLAGLDKLYEGKLEETVKNACEACTNRAYELSK